MKRFAISLFLVGIGGTVGVRAQAATTTAPPVPAGSAPPTAPAPAPAPGVETRSTFPATPLASRTFSYPSGIPYQVDTDQGLIRGTQSGYNICNGTTQNQKSLCQTSFINDVDDFCLWAPIDPNSDVADTEGEMVAWCTKPGHGSRLIPRDALQGVQFTRTPDYVQVVGFIDQTKINLKSEDYGGEMDPHGADFRGNPLGGLMYSNAWSGGGTQYTQVIEWHNFMGANYFCLKACDPSRPNAAHFCEHIYDRIGCAYNAPSALQNGTFLSCLGENQDYPGVYTDNSTGATMTYKQPPESLGPISDIPYTARVPESSECTTYTSSVLFAALANVTAPGDAGPTGSAGASGANGASGTRGASGTGAGRPVETGNAAGKIGVPALGVLGAVLGLALLA